MSERLHVGEVRAEGRTISGIVMAYGEISPSHRERFEPGSLIRREDCWLELGHDLSRVVCWEGAGLEFSEDDRALSLRAELPRIPVADLALEGVRDGSRAGLSIRFNAVEEREEDGLRVISRAELAGVGLVPAPSYSGSRVTELRGRRLRVWL